MPAPIVGTNVVTALSQRHVLPELIDMVYTKTNALFWRLSKSNKRAIAGGYHAEVTFLVSEFANGGPYQGYDVLDVAPNDTVLNGKFSFKQHYVPVTFDGRTLVQAASPEALYDIVSLGWQQARIQMSDNIATGLHSDGSNPKEITGLEAAVDDGSVATTYAGLTRSAHPYLDSQIDDTTSTLTYGAIRQMISDCTFGGHVPSLFLSRKEHYNRLAQLLIANQIYSEPNSDLTNMGFTNLSVDGVPWVLDDKVADGPNSSNSKIYCLNEDVFQLGVWGGQDFTMIDFQKPVNQDAMTGRLQWYGDLMCLNPQIQGAFTNISA
jgi:hypothetical protein